MICKKYFAYSERKTQCARRNLLQYPVAGKPAPETRREERGRDPFKLTRWRNLKILFRCSTYTGTASVPCGSTDPDCSPSFHVSSGLVESKGQPFESTNRSHAPAICEVTTAVMTSVV